ncbi:MAG: hypothetical protein OXI87_22125 [Albidovulum sp.]|nr:hypothetical protein [Albidovulum sp.]
MKASEKRNALNRMLYLTRRELGNVVTGAGPRPKAEAMERPTNPTESTRQFSNLFTSSREET